MAVPDQESVVAPPGQRRRGLSANPPSDRLLGVPTNAFLLAPPTAPAPHRPAPAGPAPEERVPQDLAGGSPAGPDLSAHDLTGHDLTGYNLAGHDLTVNDPVAVAPIGRQRTRRRPDPTADHERVPRAAYPGTGTGTGGSPGLLSGPAPEPEPPGRQARGPLLPLFATALLAWAVTSLPAPGGPRLLVGAFAAVASMSPLAAVGAVLVAALALRARRWITGGLAIAAGLLPWLFVLPYAVPASATKQPVTPVRVLVVNAHEGQADPKDISVLAREQSVDLLVVTELTSRMAHDLAVGGLDGKLVGRWVSVPPMTATGSAAQSGLGVWSRLPMSDLADVPGTRWPAVRGTLETGHGKLTVVAGHVVPPTLGSGDVWSEDLAALHRAGRVTGPVTVLGGLNGTPWNAQFRAASGNGLHDAGDVLGRGVRPTWPSWLGIPLLPLDHALVGGEVGVQSMTAVPIDGTDHRALLVTLLVPGNAS